MCVAIDCRSKNWVAVLKSLGSPALPQCLVPQQVQCHVSAYQNWEGPADNHADQRC
jgi:hypothetical protein